MNIKFWKQPTWVAFFYLLSMYGLSAFFHRELSFWDTELTRIGALAVGFILPHILGYMFWNSKPRIENLLITVLILLLLSDPDTSWLQMVVLGLLTALIKTLVRVRHQPVFNPAAAGLFAAGFFGVLTTWWGVSYAPRLPFFNISVVSLLTLFVGGYLAKLYRKMSLFIAVPLAVLASYFMMTGRLALVTILEGTFAFFLLIMAAEPKTSPSVGLQEWIYGIVMGIILAYLFVHRIAGEPYLATLLIMNLVFVVYKNIQLKLVMRNS